MFDDSLLHQVLRQLKGTILKVSVVFVVSVILSVLTAVFFSSNLGMFVMIAGICLCIFLWGIYGTPVLNYYNYIKDISIGRSRSIHGIVKKVGTRPVYKDNKLFYYELLIDEKGEERLLLMDANRPFMKFEENHPYTFEIHENYIKDARA